MLLFVVLVVSVVVVAVPQSISNTSYHIDSIAVVVSYRSSISSNRSGSFVSSFSGSISNTSNHIDSVVSDIGSVGDSSCSTAITLKVLSVVVLVVFW